MPKAPRQYLSRQQVAEHIGITPAGITKYVLPNPDVVVGPVNPDGTLPRGTVRGWSVATIEHWNANRPGRGARTDLQAPNKNT